MSVLEFEILRGQMFWGSKRREEGAKPPHLVELSKNPGERSNPALFKSVAAKYLGGVTISIVQLNAVAKVS